MGNLLKLVGVSIALIVFTVIVAVILGFMFFTNTGNVAVIEINGEIGTSSSLLSSAVSSDDIIGAVESIKENPDIKAVIISINSPGGSVVATKEIASALKSVNKPKICWLRETAASGAYWIASVCDKIVADEFTITGSIGVSGSYLEYSGLFEKYGIDYVRLVSGAEKDIGTSYRAPTAAEKASLQKIIDDISDSFTREVANNRNLSYSYVKNLSDGSVFTGKEALNYGLIDKIGDKQTVYNITKGMTNLTEINAVTFKKKLSFQDVITQFIGQSFVKYMMQDQFKVNA
jgi:protease-4